MKLSAEQVIAWYKKQEAIWSGVAKEYLYVYVMIARVWGVIDVPQVANSILKEALQQRYINPNTAEFLIEAASELREAAEEKPS